MYVQEAMLYSALLHKFTIVSMGCHAPEQYLCAAVHGRRQSCGSFWLMLFLNTMNTSDFFTNLHAKSWLCCIQITPLLNELRQGNLVGNLEALTKSASEAASDIHNLQTEVPSLCLIRMFCSITYDVTEP